MQFKIISCFLFIVKYFLQKNSFFSYLFFPSLVAIAKIRPKKPYIYIK